MPARVYALDKIEVGSESEVVEGTLSISGMSAKILIDPGSTQSFGRPKLLRDLGLKSEVLSYVVEVSTQLELEQLKSTRCIKIME